MSEFEKLMRWAKVKPLTNRTGLHEWRGCKTKKSFALKEQAQDQADRSNRNPGVRHLIHPYKCQYCEKYHNGGYSE